jgi:hypothetical protein
MHGLLQETVIDEVRDLLALANERDEYLDLDLADVNLDFWQEILASKCQNAKLFCFQICSFDQSTGRGPSGLVLATKDGEEFSRVGFFQFLPPQSHEIEGITDFDELLALSEARKLVQRSAFRGIVPRIVRII